MMGKTELQAAARKHQERRGDTDVRQLEIQVLKVSVLSHFFGALAYLLAAVALTTWLFSR